MYKKTYFNYKDLDRLKVMGKRKICLASTNPKKVGIAILISTQKTSKCRILSGIKKGNYIMIKGLILQKDITIFIVYVPNNKVSKYMKQKLMGLKRETNKSAIIGEDFNTFLSVIHKSSRQKESVRIWMT